MNKRILPEPGILSDLLIYDANYGKLYWKVREINLFTCSRIGNSWNSRFAGKETFNSPSNGDRYFRGSIFGIKLLTHRVIWAMEHLEWPSEDIDHIDGDKRNNILSNLRPASRSENLFNQGKKKENTSGYKGIYFDKRRGHWVAEIKHFCVKKYLGSFSNPQEAHEAYCLAAKKYHREFARTE